MSNQQQAADPFSSFWTEFMARAGGDGTPGAAAGPSPAFNEGAKQMQRIFFDTMAKYAEDFMRSEQFLTQIKQTMDQSLQIKAMFDDFLVKAQRGMQSPVRADVDDIASLMRGIENRVLKRLDAIEDKVAAVEESQRGGRGDKTSQTKRPSVTAGRTKAKSAGKAKK